MKNDAKTSKFSPAAPSDPDLRTLKPPLIVTPPSKRGGGGFLYFEIWIDGAAGENFEVLASFFIDFPLEIVF